MVFDQRAKAKKYKLLDGGTLEKIAQRESTSHRREFRWAQAQPAPHVTHIYLRHLDDRHANAILLAVRPHDCLLQSFDDPVR